MAQCHLQTSKPWRERRATAKTSYGVPVSTRRQANQGRRKWMASL